MNPTSVTSCKLCGRKFSGPRHLLIDPSGRSTERSAAEFYQKLIEHFMSDHPEDAAVIMISSAGYQGLLFLAQFDSTDIDFIAYRNWERWRVHQWTLNAKLMDETLEQRVRDTANFALGDYEPGQGSSLTVEVDELIEQLVEAFLPMLREMRDRFQEPIEPPNPLAPKEEKRDTVNA